jgi:hypothetical protein
MPLQQLDCQAPSRTHSESASVAALVLGVAGAPLSVFLLYLIHSFIPVLLLCAGSLTWLYVTQSRFVRSDGRRSRIAVLGIVLTFIWAVPLLIWSAIFSIVHV